jgi:hypothetical protein
MLLLADQSSGCDDFALFTGEQGGRAAYYNLSRLYEHRLGVHGEHFTAYNMLAGPFGGVHGKDLILVQSMDGKLQVFDQTAEAFTCQMTDCLLPAVCSTCSAWMLL